MIARKFRITESFFPRYRKNAFCFQTDSFRFFIVRGNHSPRFSVVVSGKQKFSSVERNKLRRRVYEYIRTETSLLSLQKVILCFYKKVGILPSREDLRTEFSLLLHSLQK